GRSGGVARAATLKKMWQRRADTTLFCLSGDFLSPSALGKAVIDGREAAGAQMVAALNAAGLDFAAFGNHEFDLSEDQLQSRIEESNFAWISANMLHASASGEVRPFTRHGRPLPRYVVVRVRKKNAEFRLGLTGVTLNFTLPAYAVYRDAGEALDEVARTIKDSTHALAAMTHLNFAQDRELASTRPEWALFMGGHEHERTFYRTSAGTVVAKADANARSAFVHLFTFRPRTQKVELKSRIVDLNARIRPDPETRRVVERWMERGRAAYRALGFEPEAVVCRVEDEWDGTEATVRNRPNALTRAIAQAIFAAGDRPDFAFYNAGSIRIDDKIRGTLTQYDLLRILPFGGTLVQAEIQGEVLRQIKAAGERNRGTGGFLHWHGDTARIENERFYRVITTEFLLTGRERNLTFFTRQNPGVRAVEDAFPIEDPRSDVRRALSLWLTQKFAPQAD
ncbi:MAG: 5'-nucleotidase C-terminal domain-containing protein, partial [Bacteroidia bacterium]|nr:bifunctional metallophosphatase/5'-nucleotidase [Bacteroidia bacterium]MDW8333735.1 5'-nucleotidase C-terminal domain-containing protein [Bacteroidia bacterium]